MDARIERVDDISVVALRHVSPYEGLGDAWGKFSNESVPKLGRRPRSAPSFEIYVNDCQKVAPAEVRTDLYLPVE